MLFRSALSDHHVPDALGGRAERDADPDLLKRVLAVAEYPRGAHQRSVEVLVDLYDSWDKRRQVVAIRRRLGNGRRSCDRTAREDLFSLDRFVAFVADQPLDLLYAGTVALDLAQLAEQFNGDVPVADRRLHACSRRDRI